MSRQNKAAVDQRRALLATNDLEAQDVLAQSLIGEVSVPGPHGARMLPPLVDETGSEVKLLFLFCGPCRSIVAAVRAFDMSRTRPGSSPLLVAIVQRVTDRETRPPTTRRYHLLIGGDAEALAARRAAFGLPELSRIVSECPVHGLQELGVAEVQSRAVQSWQAIRKAEESGDTPKAARLNMHNRTLL